MRRESSSSLPVTNTSNLESRCSWARGLLVAHIQVTPAAVDRHTQRVGAGHRHRAVHMPGRPGRPDPDRVAGERSAEAAEVRPVEHIVQRSVEKGPESEFRGPLPEGQQHPVVVADCYRQAPCWRRLGRGQSCRPRLPPKGPLYDNLLLRPESVHRAKDLRETWEQNYAYYLPSSLPAETF